ncbi:hypothetical protein ABTZ03_13935 [Kitasatospora sp. NPDC096077]|uniref:hypothetical protein n=1 Tax=Kitasatospora sp. NPDC096077 TaxID=3155544 RepID=UPI0033305E37
MQRRILTRAATFAGAALLALTAPALAHAATGLFTFQTPGGVTEQLVNPNDETCYTIDASGPADNQTNRDAQLYAGAGCRGGFTTLNAGEAGGHVDAKSVKFVR